MPANTPSLAVLTARSQKALGEFLEIELDLAATFLQTAAIEAGSDPEHCNHAVDKARIALEAVRHFRKRIEDQAKHDKIRGRADELETVLDAFRKSH
jgi:hypothetical protein